MNPINPIDPIDRFWENGYLHCIESIYDKIKKTHNRATTLWFQEDVSDALGYILENPNLFRYYSIKEVFQRLGVDSLTVADQQKIHLIGNSSIPINDVLMFQESIQDPTIRRNSWKALSSHPHLSWDFVLENLGKPWDWFRLSKNPRFSLPFIHNTPAYIQATWDWKGIAQNPSNDWSYLESYLPNPYQYISDYPNLTWKDIEVRGLSKPWNWKALSKNQAIDWNIVKTHPEIIWDWEGLSQNPNISLEFIFETFHLYPWSWKGIVKNPNLSWEFIRDHPDPKWNCMEVCKNTMWRAREKYYQRTKLSIDTIHRMYRQAAWNPEYKFCQKRLHTIWKSE